MSKELYCGNCGARIHEGTRFCIQCGKPIVQSRSPIRSSKACAICGKEQLLPFKCSYCGRPFCANHRLPENHNCDALGTGKVAKPFRTPSQESHSSPSSSYGWEIPQQHHYTYRTRRGPPTDNQMMQAYYTQMGLWSSGREMYDILIGSLFIAFFTFGIFWSGETTISALFGVVITMTLATGTGFIGHELAHKYSAQHFGIPARFVLWKQGMMITLFSAFLIMIGFGLGLAAPGFVMIMGFLNRETNGRVSAAGPTWNILSAIVCLLIGIGLEPIFPGIFRIMGVVAFINGMLAGFNLLPFGPLDGRKVYDWNPTVWGILMGCAVLLYLGIPLLGIFS
ncbi:MAG: AN1-type zinc finger domain-containing protein [Candidatus Hodarchaeota archaeon]